MNFIFLPGNSNQEWIHDVKDAFLKNFKGASFYVQEYQHHKNQDKEINFETEKKILLKHITDPEQTIIFGKSAGSLLALKTLIEENLQIKNCIFVGVPLAWAQERNIPIKNWLHVIQTPTLIIQQTSDPFASFENIKKETQNNPHLQTQEIDGESHFYGDIEKLVDLTKIFLQKDN